MLPRAGCADLQIENAAPIRAESVPASAGTWTYPIYCKTGYSLIGPCRLICKEGAGSTLAFSPPFGLDLPVCVKDYASSQFRCHYLSSACPLVWDHDTDPSHPSIAISRIFCGQILNSAPNTQLVYGFGASTFATSASGNLCMYSGGIKDDPCFIVKGQRNVPVARGIDLPAITYLGNMDGYEALRGSEDPYVGKLSRQAPYYLFPPSVTPANLVLSLRDYHETCVKRHGQKITKCSLLTVLTSAKNGYDIVMMFGGDSFTNGILDAFPLRPAASCLAKQCCCDLNTVQTVVKI